MMSSYLSKHILTAGLSVSCLLGFASATLAETIDMESPASEQSIEEEISIEVRSEQEISYPRLFANAELGFVSVLGHSIQFSKNNSMIDYVKDGGQDNLFNLAKLSLDLELDPHQSITFLYQPLTFDTRAVIERDLSIDNVSFPAGTPMTFRYDFPFFRGSYLYDFDADPKQELAAGISLQIRDAVIEFASLNGDKFVSNRNVGPVPILKFRSKHYFNEKFWWGSEVDGFYAPISLLNGSTTDVIGSILDANLRAGWDIDARNAAFVNLRYIGGGAVGTSNNPKAQGDGFNENWLHTFGLTLGVRTGLF